MKSTCFKLPAALYSLESLRAASRVLGRGLRVSLERKGRVCAVILRSAKARGRRSFNVLAGEFLNEALSHRYRQKVLRFNRARIQPVMSEVLRNARVMVSPDPLERLEPQVAEDRRRDADELLEAARRLS